MMARPIGAYFHEAHGVSNASLLPLVMEFSILGNPQKYAAIAEAMGEVTEGLSPLVLMASNQSPCRPWASMKREKTCSYP